MIPVWTPPKIHYWWEQLYWALAMRRSSFDVFHFPISAGPVVMRRNVVVTVHDLTFRLFPQTMTKQSRFYWGLSMRWSIQRVAHIIADSESTREDIKQYFSVPEDKISVVPPYVPKEFKPDADPSVAALVRARYGLPSRFILYVGTLEPRKNLIRLLQAFQAIKQRGFPHTLVLAGKKWWGSAEVEKAIGELGLSEYVLLLDYIPAGDLPALYNAAELFVFPSLYEGFGLPVLEAMACGTPVLVSDAASLPEVVGDAGLLVNPCDTSQWADAMAEVLNDPNRRQVLGEKALRRAQLFSQERTVRGTIKVYGQVAGHAS